MTLFATAGQAQQNATTATEATVKTFLALYKLSEDCDQSRIFNKVISETLKIDFSTREITGLPLKFNWYKFRGNETEFGNYFATMLTPYNLTVMFQSFLVLGKPHTKAALENFKPEIDKLVNTVVLNDEEQTEQFQDEQFNAIYTTNEAAKAQDIKQVTEQKTEPKTETTMQTNETILAPAAPAVSLGATLDLGSLISTSVNQALKPAFDAVVLSYEQRFNEAVKAEAAKQNPNNYYINGSTTANTVTGKTHSDFNEIVETMAILKCAYLKGPSGSGKSFMGKQIAEALGVNFLSMEITAGITESDFFGRMLPDGSFRTTNFLEIYENGGVILIDEVDAGDCNAFVSVNNALSNGFASVPNRTENKIAVRHPECYILAAGNTWGKGVTDNMVAREIQDEAFLKRFEFAFFEVNYCEELERELLIDTPELFDAMIALRQAAAAERLNLTVATRDMVKAQSLFLQGFTVEKLVNRYIKRFSEYEQSKILNALGF
jgi:hypothetical protein